MMDRADNFCYFYVEDILILILTEWFKGGLNES